jgi:hypothetical protein
LPCQLGQDRRASDGAISNRAVGPGSLFLFLFLFPVRARARETEGEREREHNGEVIAMAAVAMEMRETETVEEEDPLGPPTNPMVSVLLTDMYQLSMAYAYWKAGKHNDSAVYVSSLSLSLSLSLSPALNHLAPLFLFLFSLLSLNYSLPIIMWEVHLSRR